MPSQTASRHEVSCCKHGGSFPLSLSPAVRSAFWIGGFSSQVHHPPVCPSHWNSLAAHITSNEIFGLAVSHPAMRPERSAVSMLSRKKA